MAAVIKRHWLVVVFCALLAIGGVAAGLLLFHKSAPPAAAAVQQEEPAAAPAGASLIERYQRVAELRQLLRLDAQTLAGIGCDQAQAEQAFASLAAWEQTNAAAWEQNESAQRAKQRQISEAMRLVNIGPRDEALLRRLPEMQRELSQVMQERQRLLQSAADAVALEASAKEAWSNLRKKGHLPGAYGFVPDLKAKTVAQFQRGTQDLGAAEQAALSPAQATALAESRQRIQQNIEGVLAAEQKVLPRP